MALSIVELARARDAASGLLDELGLEAYLFEIEPHDALWELNVDCVMKAGSAWESVRLTVPKEALLVSQEDVALRQRILKEWQDRLAACKLQSGPDGG